MVRSEKSRHAAVVRAPRAYRGRQRRQVRRGVPGRAIPRRVTSRRARRPRLAESRLDLAFFFARQGAFDAAGVDRDTEFGFDPLGE